MQRGGTRDEGGRDACKGKREESDWVGWPGRKPWAPEQRCFPLSLWGVSQLKLRHHSQSLRVYVSQNKRCEWRFYTRLQASTSVCGYRNIGLLLFLLGNGLSVSLTMGLFEQWEKVSVQPAWMNFFQLHQLTLSPLQIWMLLCGLRSSRRWNIRSQSISMRNTQKGAKSGPGWVRADTCFSFLLLLLIFKPIGGARRWLWVRGGCRSTLPLISIINSHLFHIISKHREVCEASDSLSLHWALNCVPTPTPQRHTEVLTRYLSMWRYLEIGILKM